MAVFSKPLRIDCTCYELGHCWTPSCVKASTDIAQNVFGEALKIYGALYLLTAVIKRRGWKYYVKKLVPETLRSSVFLAVNGTGFIFFFCVWRKLMGYYTFCDTFIGGMPVNAVSILIEPKHRRILGGFNFLTSSFVPAYIGATAAILCERKNRRGPLAIYMTNLAIETGYRMLMNRGLARSVPNGEVLLFSLASAIYLYLFKKKNGLPGSTLSVFKFLVGADENPDSKDSTIKTPSVTAPSSPGNNNTVSLSKEAGSSRSQSALATLMKMRGTRRVVQTVGPPWKSLVGRLKGSLRHRSCPHPHGCLHYVLKGLFKMFGVGYVVQLLIKVISSLPAIRRRPAEILKALWGPHSFGLATFLGLYSGIYRGVNCTLRWLRKRDDDVHGMVAGFLAGGAMYFYKSLTMGLFMSAKAVELLYFKGIEAGRVPYIPYTDLAVYAFSCAFVFHAAVVEPHALRPAYWKWLMMVTHGKFALVNRKLLDVFGTHSSKMFPDYWPNYDMRYTDLQPPS